MAPQESKLPSWTCVGAKCKWHSESTKAVHTVVVTSVDLVKRRVVVHFEADHKVWKTVPFAYAGGTGPLQPYDGPARQSGQDGKDASAASQQAGAKAPPKGDRKGEQDGTSTPPWYEQLHAAENREGIKHDKKRAEMELTERQLDRQKRWQQAQKQRHDEEARRREVDRKRSEEDAEKERLRILEKLRLERELEQLRMREVQFMQVEDALSDRYVNQPIRLAELMQREVEERRRAEQMREEEAARRERELKFREELANRPLISFGVKLRQEPCRVQLTQPSQQPVAQEEQAAAPPALAEPVVSEPALDLDALAAAQRWADAYSAGSAGAQDPSVVPEPEPAAYPSADAASSHAYQGYAQQHAAAYSAHGYEQRQGYGEQKLTPPQHDDWGPQIAPPQHGDWGQHFAVPQHAAPQYDGDGPQYTAPRHDDWGQEDAGAFMQDPSPELKGPPPKEPVHERSEHETTKPKSAPPAGKFARKSSAPAPPEPLAAPKPGAPTASALMARFASLVTAAEEARDEPLQGGAPQRVDSGEELGAPEPRKRSSGGGAVPSSSRRHEDADPDGPESFGRGIRRPYASSPGPALREPPPRPPSGSADSGTRSRGFGGREDTGYRDGGGSSRDGGGAGSSSGYRGAAGAGHRDADDHGSGGCAGGYNDRHEDSSYYYNQGGREGYCGSGYADEGYRDRRSRSRDRERHGGYASGSWEEGRGRDGGRRELEQPWRHRGGATTRGSYS